MIYLAALIAALVAFIAWRWNKPPILTPYFAFSVGYHIQTDSPYGLTIAVGQRLVEKYILDEMGIIRKVLAVRKSRPCYRAALSIYCDRPQIAWANERWAVNEPGYLVGMPVPRRGVQSSAWTGREWHIRSVSWVRGWSFNRYG